MKALSLTRPWPELILRCGKRIENRTWDTGYRGPVLLHAAKSWVAGAIDYAEEVEVALDQDLDVSAVSWHADDHPVGIVGVAVLVDVCSPNGITYCRCGPWAMRGQYHWRLSSVRRLPKVVPCNGALGLWTPPADVRLAAENLLVSAR